MSWRPTPMSDDEIEDEPAIEKPTPSPRPRRTPRPVEEYTPAVPMHTIPDSQWQQLRDACLGIINSLWRSALHHPTHMVSRLNWMRQMMTILNITPPEDENHE